MKSDHLVVSPGPHLHGGARISGIYYQFLLALLPAVIFGISHYGFDALDVIGLSMATAMISEMLMQKLLRKPVTIADGSAAVSGLLLALILPAHSPAYIVVVASSLGIIIGKQCFGGLGANPLNPALVGWAIVRITKPWAGFLDFDLILVNTDPGFPIEYPLSVLRVMGPAALDNFNMWELFLGRQTGGIGGAEIAALLAGGIYLVLAGKIRWQIPLFFLLGIVIAASMFHIANKEQFVGPMFHILTGNVIIGAFFLSTDFSSSPVNRWGMIIYGLCCGFLTIILRTWSTYLDGVVFACLLMSLFVPLLDKIKSKQVVAEPVLIPETMENALEVADQ
jgi:H+/Na+-translocating ferredoxin:NAD+ oxidoreductase subunit D